MIATLSEFVAVQGQQQQPMQPGMMQAGGGGFMQ